MFLGLGQSFFTCGLFCGLAAGYLLFPPPSDDDLRSPSTRLKFPWNQFRTIKQETAPADGQVWAFLVAGSSSYYNYRHQADVCHAFQVLKKNGFPEDRIIVMMPDDIADNHMNPVKGEIINRPGGPNVYPGVKKDYTHSEVNVKNFLNVLTGNKTAMQGIGSGRVIESGPNDIVFVNFVDHGGPGVLFFDDETLTADVLLEALNGMRNRKQFSKLVMYIEACHAGSMFDALLPDDMDIFVMTASDPFESSYACYYDEKRETYLGDVFSVSWLYDAENEDISRESIHHMFEKVRTMTNTSHVEEYGELDLGDACVSQVLSGSTKLTEMSNDIHEYQPMQAISDDDVASTFDVPLSIVTRRLSKEQDPSKRQYLYDKKQTMLKARQLVDETVSKIVHKVVDGHYDKKELINTGRFKLRHSNFPCYKDAMNYFSEQCFNINKNPYARSHLTKLVNMCSVPWLKIDDIKFAINVVCKYPSFNKLFAYTTIY